MVQSCKWPLMFVLPMMVLGQGILPAQAQTGPTPMPASSTPVSMTPASPPQIDAPQFIPSSGWSVQPSVFAKVRGLQDINLPCMMASTYDNGYGLRFSGGDNKILAMAIDFRQNVFAQGRKYPAELRLSEGYDRVISGTAFSKSVLIFNMRELGSFYSAVSKAQSMTLNIEDNVMVFRLSGVKNALMNMEKCSTGKAPTTQNASVNDNGEPQPLMWEDEVTPVPAKVSKEMQEAAMNEMPVWRAKAGDDLKKVLEDWAGRAGVTLDWQATGDAKVANDVRFEGPFQEAVRVLMAQNAAAADLDANMMNAPDMSVPAPSSAMRHVRGGAVSVPPATRDPQNLSPASTYSSGRMGVSEGGASARWSASAGVSLQQILQSWSDKAGVELIWESNQGFAVKRPVRAGGSYEEALQSLLNQYSNEKIRPAAQLNNDPSTGRRTLFVRSSRVL